jgi:hypothetical protein
MPSVKQYLSSNNLKERILLLLDHCPVHSSSDILKSKDRKINATFLPKNTTAPIQKKAYCRVELLCEGVNSELQATEFLKTLTLKDVAYSVSLAWEEIKTKATGNCWGKEYWKR